MEAQRSRWGVETVRRKNQRAHAEADYDEETAFGN